MSLIYEMLCLGTLYFKYLYGGVSNILEGVLGITRITTNVFLPQVVKKPTNIGHNEAASIAAVATTVWYTLIQSKAISLKGIVDLGPL